MMNRDRACLEPGSGGKKGLYQLLLAEDRLKFIPISHSQFVPQTSFVPSWINLCNKTLQPSPLSWVSNFLDFLSSNWPLSQHT